MNGDHNKNSISLWYRPGKGASVTAKSQPQHWQISQICSILIKIPMQDPPPTSLPAYWIKPLQFFKSLNKWNFMLTKFLRLELNFFLHVLFCPPPQKKGVVWISNYKSHTYKSVDVAHWICIVLQLDTKFQYVPVWDHQSKNMKSKETEVQEPEKYRWPTSKICSIKR